MKALLAHLRALLSGPEEAVTVGATFDQPIGNEDDTVVPGYSEEDLDGPTVPRTSL